jgi:hypothetical protein
VTESALVVSGAPAPGALATRFGLLQFPLKDVDRDER